jgi:ABC-type methionine transport system permease subunit
VGLSKTELLLTISIFYALLGVFMGLMGSLDTPVSYDEDTLTDNSKFNFLPSIITGFDSCPLWLQIIFFTPLTVAIFFIIVTSVFPTLNGGS